jgi:hypothetical protein
MEQLIEVTTRLGRSMNLNDKISVINSRIDYYNNNLKEHNRILNEEIDLLSLGDEEVILSMISNIQEIIKALNDVKTRLTTE